MLALAGGDQLRLDVVTHARVDPAQIDLAWCEMRVWHQDPAVDEPAKLLTLRNENFKLIEGRAVEPGPGRRKPDVESIRKVVKYLVPAAGAQMMGLVPDHKTRLIESLMTTQ